MAPGTFIEPNHDLAGVADPAAALGITISSGYQARAQKAAFEGQSRFFDAILAAQARADFPYEDQCSAQYYFDLVKTLRDFNGEFDRVVEVGVFMGGSTSVLAGCMEPFGFDLDLVDISRDYLLFAHERVRRTYPKNPGRIRLFHGDLPSYVGAAMLGESEGRSIIHHDGSHSFDVVVRDLASLSFVQKRLLAVIAQDTHLRGAPEFMNFVDLAIHGVFGMDVKCAPIGTTYPPYDSRTEPNKYQGNYFMPNAPEGLVIPMAINTFHYPHPLLKIGDFIPGAQADAPR